MSVRPWFKCWSSDWLGSARVAELTAAQQGVYWRLLCAQWDLGSLPADAAKCRPWAPWDASTAEVRHVIEAFFPLCEDGRRRNPKLVAESLEADDRSRRAKEAVAERERQKRARAGQRGSSDGSNDRSSDPSTDTSSDLSGMGSGDGSKGGGFDTATRARDQMPGPGPGPGAEPGAEVSQASPDSSRKRDGSPDRVTRTTRSVDVQAVVDHYRTLHPQAKPGTRERALIAARLQEGYTPDELRRSIDGFHRSPWHTGENPGGKVYLGLKLLMRDSSQVATGLEHASGQTTRGAGMSEREMRGRRAGDEWLASMAARDQSTGRQDGQQDEPIEETTFEVH